MSEDNTESESSKLIVAAKASDVAGVTSALRAGADKEFGDLERHNFRALHWSAEKGHKEVVLKLLNIGVDVNAREDRGRTALHQICFYGHEDIARLLIGRGALIDAISKEGFTPLMSASQAGYDFLVLLFLNAGANIKLQDEDCCTAIHYASRTGKHSVVNILAECGADLKLKNKYDSQPIYLAAMNGYGLTVDTLSKLGADVNCINNDGCRPIHIAALEGHDLTVAKLIQLGANVNCTDKKDQAPLWMASQNGHIKTVKILLENIAQVDMKNVEGTTALCMASVNGHAATAHMLITHGANVNATKTDGVTPLMLATRWGKDELVTLLISYGANIEAVMNRNGESALLQACNNGHLSVVQILIKEGADLNTKSKNGIAPLWIASDKGYDGIVEALLQNGAQKNITNGGWQSVHTSAFKGHLNVLVKLNKYGGNLNAKTSQDKTPLHFAVENNHVIVAEWLVVNGANPHACDKVGNTPIQLATKKGQGELVSFMRQPPTEKLQSMSLNQVDSGSSRNASSAHLKDTNPSLTPASPNHECIICMTPRTTTVLTLPCRHAVTCQKCIDDLEERGDNRCPLCRTEIIQRIPIFIN